MNTLAGFEKAAKDAYENYPPQPPLEIPVLSNFENYILGYTVYVNYEKINDTSYWDPFEK